MATVEANLQHNARMADNIGTRSNGGHRAHVASVDHRLADKWHCAIGTAKARRERAVADTLDMVEACLGCGDTDRLAHLLNLLDAVLAGQPQLPRLDAIYAADRSDAEEDVLQCQYRENPTKATARAWFDALGREARKNEPAMAHLREQWAL